MNNQFREQYFDTAATSEYLGVSTETLKGWRSRGKGPKYRKLPNGKVTYRRTDLDAFNAACVVDPKAA
jgi:hypothetical protein